MEKPWFSFLHGTEFHSSRMRSVALVKIPLYAYKNYSHCVCASISFVFTIFQVRSLFSQPLAVFNHRGIFDVRTSPQGSSPLSEKAIHTIHYLRIKVFFFPFHESFTPTPFYSIFHLWKSRVQEANLVCLHQSRTLYPLIDFTHTPHPITTITTILQSI